MAILLASRSSERPFYTSLLRWNPALPVVLLGVAGMLTLVFAVGPLRSLFGFSNEPVLTLLAAFACGAAPVLVFDFTKLLRRRHQGVIQ